MSNALYAPIDQDEVKKKEIRGMAGIDSLNIGFTRVHLAARNVSQESLELLRSTTKKEIF